MERVRDITDGRRGRVSGIHSHNGRGTITMKVIVGNLEPFPAWGGRCPRSV
jgi:hypothetical protein